MSEQFSHIPVLLNETLALLAPERGGIFVDGTLGGGGHAEAVLTRLGQTDRLIGIDRDWEAVHAAGERLSTFGERVEIWNPETLAAYNAASEETYSDSLAHLAELGI